MSEDLEPHPITIALDVDDPELADRLSALLTDITGLRLVRANDTADAVIFSPHPSDKGAEADIVLTPRELEVLGLVAEGESNKSIARRLGISVHTAKFHVASVLDKLDATGRTDAVAHAARLGIIQL